ncbi:hypothetical protein PG997_013474 [Apiospora hydei]|uniref:Uncharacterized protein n=1 Tax=Apiospora hydei TaxID=1337664 RepID=A0ABR1V716_9PEZI
MSRFCLHCNALGSSCYRQCSFSPFLGFGPSPESFLNGANLPVPDSATVPTPGFSAAPPTLGFTGVPTSGLAGVPTPCSATRAVSVPAANNRSWSTTPGFVPNASAPGFYGPANAPYTPSPLGHSYGAQAGPRGVPLGQQASRPDDGVTGAVNSIAHHKRGIIRNLQQHHERTVQAMREEPPAGEGCPGSVHSHASRANRRAPAKPLGVG